MSVQFIAQGLLNQFGSVVVSATVSLEIGQRIIVPGYDDQPVGEAIVVERATSEEFWEQSRFAMAHLGATAPWMTGEHFYRVVAE